MGCLTAKGIFASVGVLFPSHPCHQHVCAFTVYDQEQIKAQNGAQIYQNYWVFFAASPHAVRPAAPSFLLLPAGSHLAFLPLLLSPWCRGQGRQLSPPGGATCTCATSVPAPAAAERRSAPQERVPIRSCGAGQAAARARFVCRAREECSRGSHIGNIWACKLNWLYLEGVEGIYCNPTKCQAAK